ncbi:MAG: hypothetical protein JWN76_1846 [Chitinophagaceae bacterium]|nr:hypothetical protein [Chitinophagaceae bacterium]
MRYLLIISLFIIATSAYAQDGWVKIAEAKGGMYCFYQPTKTTVENSIVHTWIKTYLTQETRKKYNILPLHTDAAHAHDYSYLIEEINFDCRNVTHKVEEAILYNANGTVAKSRSIGDFAARYNTIVPDSILVLISNKLCKDVK